MAFSHGVAVALVALSVLALGLRIGASTRLLPLCPEPDSSMVWKYRAICGEDTYVPASGYDGVYPNLLPCLLAAMPGCSTLPGAGADAVLEDHLETASAPYHRLRLLAALIAALLPAAVFLVARRFMPDGWALLAAAFQVVCLMHQAHSAIAKGHAPGVTFAWYTLWLVLRQLESPTWGRRIATAAAATAAIGTTQTGLFVLAPAAIRLLVPRPFAREGSWKDALVIPLALLGAAPFLSGGIGLSSEGVTLGHGHTIRFERAGDGLSLWTQFLWEHDPVLTALGALGFVLALFSIRPAWRDTWRRTQVAVLASYALPYMAILSVYDFMRPRYVLPLHPLVAILAASAVAWMSRRLPLRAGRGALIPLALAFPGWVSARYLWIGIRPDTFEQLGAWIERQPDATSRRIVLSPCLSPPLYPTQDALERQLETTTGRAQEWFYYLGKLDALPADAPHFHLGALDPDLYQKGTRTGREHVAWLDERNPDWIVLEDSNRIVSSNGLRQWIRTVRKHGELLATFSGEGGRHAGGIPIDYQRVRDLAARVLVADAHGPHIEVYRWRGRQEKRRR